jgi:hypothetical protein
MRAEGLKPPERRGGSRLPRASATEGQKAGDGIGPDHSPRGGPKEARYVKSRKTISERFPAASCEEIDVVI